MEEKSAVLLNTKSQHLFLKAAGLLGSAPGNCCCTLTAPLPAPGQGELSYGLGCVPLGSVVRPCTQQLPGNTWGPLLHDEPGRSKTQPLQEGCSTAWDAGHREVCF